MGQTSHISLPETDDIAIVVSRYNASVTDALLDGAIQTARGRAKSGQVLVLDAPGTFELPAIALHAALSGKFAGVCCLGCVIRGETSHDAHIARAVAHGLVDITLKTGVPVAFGVITADTAEQARQRSGGAKGNKGTDSMLALLDAIASIRSIASGRRLESRQVTDKAAGGRA